MNESRYIDMSKLVLATYYTHNVMFQCSCFCLFSPPVVAIAWQVSNLRYQSIICEQSVWIPPSDMPFCLFRFLIALTFHCVSQIWSSIDWLLHSSTPPTMVQDPYRYQRGLSRFLDPQQSRNPSAAVVESIGRHRIVQKMVCSSLNIAWNQGYRAFIRSEWMFRRDLGHHNLDSKASLRYESVPKQRQWLFFLFC